MKEKIALYMHGGSGNHGCEAIINSTCKMIENPVAVLSTRAEEDRKYTLEDLCEIYQERNPVSDVWTHGIYYLRKNFLKQQNAYATYRFKDILKTDCNTYVSVGGDNYCYDSMLEELMEANRMLVESGKQTVLWGCSIEPELLKRKAIKEDLQRYSMIVARESITYHALLNAGIKSNIFLYPDPAFSLTALKNQKENVIGINLSPMIVRHEKQTGIALESFKNVITYLLENTDLHIKLIPHVIWQHDDDRTVLKQLYEPFRNTERVELIEDQDCISLKSIISGCRFFVGARTHATIAAYSSCVPTLVVGYSVKSRGIARDLFGTEEHYVIPIQEITNDWQLIDSIKWLMENEQSMKQHLEAVMPQYVERAVEAGRKLMEQVEMYKC